MEVRSGPIENPEELRADIERMIELDREGVRGDLEQEIKTWLDKLTEADRQRSRAQDMAIQGLLDYDELRTKLASLEETRKAAEYELVALKDHREHIAELERDKEAVLEHYSAIAPEALDLLAPEECRHLYGLLRLKALQHPDGTTEVELSGAPESNSITKENTSANILPGTKAAGLRSYTQRRC